MQITKNTVVTLHYPVSSEDGVEIDSSHSGKPMTVLHGSHYLIVGLENALDGKSAGDKFDVDVAPELAYGLRQDGLVQSVPKSMFDGMDVSVGMQFRATTDEGEQSVIVIDVSDDQVLVDGNHPLAGHTLKFDVEVREATEDELKQGRALEKDCCVESGGKCC